MANVDSSLKNWSTTAGSNQPEAADAATVAADLREIQAAVRGDLATKGADIVCAATIDLGAVQGSSHDITGSTGPVTSFGTVSAGIRKTIKFEGTPTLTHNATSLILPGATNIVCAVGDMLEAESEGGGNWRVHWFSKASGTPVVVAMPAMYIQGNTYGNGDGAGAGDQTNDITITAGKCRDATDAVDMTCTALTKQLDAAWAVGSAAGGLDTGAIGNSDYYIWRIKRSDTGVVDALFSLSSTAPTMPTNYDFKRLVGWFKRVGGLIVTFHTYEQDGGGIELTWDATTLDINLSNTLTTARRADAVKVPLNFSTTAHLNVYVSDAAAGFVCWICCPDQNDSTPSVAGAPLTNIGSPAGAGSGLSQMRIRTSATGTIAARATIATVDTYNVSTMGFTWSRRN